IVGFSGLKNSWHAIDSANLALIFIALCCIALSYVAAAITYVLLTPRKLRLGPTIMIQIAGGLANRLLPAGLGGLGLNGLYIHRRGYSAVTSAAIVATNNLLGFVGNLILVVVAVMFASLPSAHLHVPKFSRWLLVGA